MSDMEHYDRFYRRLAAGDDLHLLNTTIVPPIAEDGMWEVVSIKTACAKRLAGAAVQHTAEGHPVGGRLFIHIGHEATAAVASELFGVEIEADRSPWDGSGIGLALQLKGRIPEGSILSREQMEEISFGWRVIARSYRVAVLEAALRAFVEKLPLCEEALSGIYAMAHVHGAVYRGPTYVAEMAEARRVLGMEQA